MGPRLSAGKNVSAPTMMITPINSALNSGVVTGNVPSDGGTYFFCARLPAIASIGMIMKNRPSSMSKPILVSYHGVLTVSPPKAEPLLPAPETYAYSICVNPCGPGLLMPAVPKLSTDENQTRDEHRELHMDQNPVHARADAAEDHLTEHDVDQRNHASERHVGIEPAIDRAAAGIRGHSSKESRIRNAKTNLLAFHIAAGLHGAGVLIHAMRE